MASTGYIPPADYTQPSTSNSTANSQHRADPLPLLNRQVPHDKSWDGMPMATTVEVGKDVYGNDIATTSFLSLWGIVGLVGLLTCCFGAWKLLETVMSKGDGGQHNLVMSYLGGIGLIAIGGLIISFAS